MDPDGIDQITTTNTTHENDTMFGEARVTTTLRGDNQADAVVAIESTDGLLRATIIGGNPTVTVTEYNTGGFTRRETTTFPDETTEVLAFDGAGRLASRQLRDIHGTPLESMTRAYNKWGDLEEEENPASGVTAYEFYADGNLKKITVPAPDSGTWTTEWAYFDEQPGRRIETTLPDTSTRIEHLLPNGLPHRRHGAGEYPVQFAYGPAGRIDAMRTWRTFSDWDTGYDETLWHYNDAGLLERKEYADGKGTDYTYTPAGLRHTRTWERGVTTTYIYDDAGRPDTTTHSDDTPGIDWTYNRAGRLTGVTDALGTHTLSYEPSGRLQSHTIDGGPLDGLAIVNTFTNGKHEDFTAALDAEDLLLHRHQYDPDTGRLKSVAALEPTAETQIGRADYAYWPESHRTGAITYHNSTAEVLTVETTYDDGLRVEKITAEGTTANTLRLFDHTLDPRSRRTRIDREDDTYWSYTYNNRNEVKTGVKHFPGDAPIPGHDFGYTFDNIGNRIEIAREGEDYGYTPNNLNQITERVVPAEHVVTGTADPQADILVNEEPADRVGDFWSKTLTVDNTQFPGYKAITIEATIEGAGPHGQTLLATADGGTFITPQTPESFVYDDDGNLLEDGRNTYTWDANNRLIAIEPHPEFLIISDPQRLEFLYDFQGRRVAKKAYNWNHTLYEWDLATETYFIYDGLNMVAELQLNADTETLELAQSYLWGRDLSGSMQGAGGVGGLLAVLDHTDGTDVHFAISDANGNVSALVDGSDGTLSAEYGYGTFGEPTKTIGSMAKKNPFRFSTKYTDNETGFVYYGFRYYEPATGSWLNRDPIEEQGGPNLYAIVANNPVNAWDYLGLIILEFNAFIPGFLGETIAGQSGTWLPEPGLSTWWFRTDGRNHGQKGTSRVRSKSRNITPFEIGNLEQHGSSLFITESDATSRISRNPILGNHDPRLPQPDMLEQTDVSSPSQTVKVKDIDQCTSEISVRASGSYPFAASPKINYNIKFRLQRVGGTQVKVTISGRHNDFPAYEGLVDGDLLYQAQASGDGPTIWNLGVFWRSIREQSKTYSWSP